jgi:hypothetical protein
MPETSFPLDVFDDLLCRTLQCYQLFWGQVVSPRRSIISSTTTLSSIMIIARTMHRYVEVTNKKRDRVRTVSAVPLSNGMDV